MREAMEARPPHLLGLRWPVERVATEFALHLEQMGTSLEARTKNIDRLCVALGLGIVENRKVVGVSAVDLQRIAAKWGIVIDRPQARELFALRKCSADEPVPIALFVRRFCEPLTSESDILADSRQRSVIRPPPVDYGGGSGPYVGGQPNALEQARMRAYKSVGDNRHTEFHVRFASFPATAGPGRAGLRCAKSDVALYRGSALVSHAAAASLAYSVLSALPPARNQLFR